MFEKVYRNAIRAIENSNLSYEEKMRHYQRLMHSREIHLVREGKLKIKTLPKTNSEFLSIWNKEFEDRMHNRNEYSDEIYRELDEKWRNVIPYPIHMSEQDGVILSDEEEPRFLAG